jgi:hypothetical protein
MPKPKPNRHAASKPRATSALLPWGATADAIENETMINDVATKAAEQEIPRKTFEWM